MFCPVAFQLEFQGAERAVVGSLRLPGRLRLEAGKLVHKPHFPMLRENNVRAGFFEREQYLSVLRHLPTSMQPVVTFAYLTGWRIASEVLPLQWRQVDLQAGEVRLDPARRRTSRVASST